MSQKKKKKKEGKGREERKKRKKVIEAHKPKMKLSVHSPFYFYK
jgi:ribosomal protein L18